MSDFALLLIGCPDSGKTNYIARMWAAVRDGKSALTLPRASKDITYVEEALAHLLMGKFAPRSDKSLEGQRHDIVVPLGRAKGISTEEVDLAVPDVTGELWNHAVENSEISEEWMNQMRQSSGALLFVRVLSDQNSAPLDWVNSARLLKMGYAEAKAALSIPTQVALSQLLRFLEYTLRAPSEAAKPRVAVVVTAWDLLDSERAKAGPLNFLKTEFPIFAGRIQDTSKVDISIFGVSIVGGDLEADPQFREQFVRGDLNSSGYVVCDSKNGVERHSDLTMPIAWLLGDKS